MRVLDLFAGIGGFSLAAHWMGWETVAFVEKEPFCQKVLAKNFPGVPIYGDIFEFDGKPLRGSVDIVCGGFPCQPYSLAGKRQGTSDSRHLWPEMLRTIREVAPRFVVGENVFGLVNWSGGLVFEQVFADLEAAGYEVWAGLLPACGIGAPHRRERIWFIADANRSTNLRIAREYAKPSNSQRIPKRHEIQQPAESVGLRLSPNANGQLLQGKPHEGILSCGWKERDEQSPGLLCPRWEEYPTQPFLWRRTHGVPNRMDRIKALGNSIVPQIAFEIFKAIEEASK